jgi:hypothetical protein
MIVGIRAGRADEQRLARSLAGGCFCVLGAFVRVALDFLLVIYRSDLINAIPWLRSIAKPS